MKIKVKLLCILICVCMFNKSIVYAEMEWYNQENIEEICTLYNQNKIYLDILKKKERSVAIIVSRKGADENALAAAKGCLRESGKLILCLSDEDLKELLRIKEKDEQPTAEFFEAMLDDLLIHLEK